MAVTQIDSNNLQPTFQLGHPTITNVQVTNSSYVVVDDTAVSTSGGYIKITGSMFNSGVQVYIGSILATSISIVSSTVLNVQVPATAAGSYDLIVVNTNGTYCIKPIGITFSPINITWVTSSNLGPYQTGVAISLQLNATGATGYQLQSGSTLPTGLTLTSGGLLSGTVTVVSDTTYSFTIEAYDSELQDAPRTFSLSIRLDPVFSAEYLVVAGAGAGGQMVLAPGSILGAGGGGAGGYLSGTVADVYSNTYTIIVGAGAVGSPGGVGPTAPNGSNSIFDTITAIGGGSGAVVGYVPGNGGSGAGGPGNVAAGTGTIGQGNDGGAGSTSTTGYGGGGGGGAGGAGTAGTGTGGGAGGAGLASSITGTSVFRGGGGGGGTSQNGLPGGTATAGGGSGSVGSNGSLAVAGTANTGGGGGGSGTRVSNPQKGANGGSGIVIIRYPDSNPAATSTTGSPTITVAGGYRVYQFTGSGSITF
jgi:hypothetical protein